MYFRFCDGLSALVRFLTWVGFAALIITVSLQVLARNVFQVPMIWTGDVAQLLFGWLIFIGAALGFRRGAHYRVDMVPANKPLLNAMANVISFAAGLCVAWLLLRYGWELASIRATATVQSIGISRFWMFLPMPLAGALIFLYLGEMALRLRQESAA